ncbi:MAG TPA: type I-C CRISPR-associated endonuclease Cas1c [Syntrophomonas sp.]|nr:type I-C CRISPR-associated endonuclease Cas1c [Syntrophomonas sp.]
MKKLQNTLYVTSPNAYLSLDGENIVIVKDDTEAARFPLHNIGQIITFGYMGASPALMGACAKRSISLCFLTRNGRFLARVLGESQGNVTLRREQYAIASSDERSILLARNFILGKVYNAKWSVERTIRDYPLRVDAVSLKEVSAKLTDFLNCIRQCDDFEQLRGFEGKAASEYFKVFDDFILQQKGDFYFKGRNKRPPLDNVNALLSFAYTLLANDVASALEAVGLDAYVGFFHRDRPGRTSLALDIMEELRPICADRFVLSLINKRMVDSFGFTKKENGAVIMDDETRKIVLNAWQARKQEELTHPFLSEKIQWGLVPHVQAMLLARHIRGDLDEYPPFLWK